MHYLFLFLIWFTPAMIAGMLGWSGIWGSGNAFTEYLIPLPVAGGAFHIPGLIISFIALRTLNGEEFIINRYIGYGAFVLLVAMLALHIDFPRFYNWLTTDYQPSGFPIRFDSNALYLFILTDAFWVWVYALIKGARFDKTTILIALSIPPAALILQVGAYKASGPGFTIGGAAPGENRGQETQYIFTTAEYDESLLLGWLGEKNYLGAPWANANTEHEAIVFTNSMQLIKWKKFDEINNNNVIATVCSYEEDKSRSIHQGLYDCFTGRDTLQMKLEKIMAKHPSGIHPWIDHWYARTILCETVTIPTDRMRHNIALYNTCIDLSINLESDIKKFKDRLTNKSEAIAFVSARAEEAGLPKIIPPFN